MQKQSITNNLGKQGELLDMERTTKLLKQLNIESKTLQTQADTSYKKKSLQWIDSIKEATLHNLQESTNVNKMRSNLMLKEHEDWTKYGLRPNDSFMWRGALQFFK